MNTTLSAAALALPDVKLVTPKHVADERGYFMEVWREDTFAALGLPGRFMQVNQSGSRGGTLRGLHYQVQRPQGKLVRVVSGRIFDVAVDVRRSSRTFGRWVGVTLDAVERTMLWIPAGFAHGFYVQSDHAEMEYFCTDVHCPEGERAVAWDDPRIGIDWPLDPARPLLLSERDRRAGTLDTADTFP